MVEGPARTSNHKSYSPTERRPTSSRFSTVPPAVVTTVMVASARESIKRGWDQPVHGTLWYTSPPVAVAGTRRIRSSYCPAAAPPNTLTVTFLLHPRGNTCGRLL